MLIFTLRRRIAAVNGLRSSTGRWQVVAIVCVIAYVALLLVSWEEASYFIGPGGRKIALHHETVKQLVQGGGGTISALGRLFSASNLTYAHPVAGVHGVAGVACVVVAVAALAALVGGIREPRLRIAAAGLCVLLLIATVVRFIERVELPRFDYHLVAPAWLALAASVVAAAGAILAWRGERTEPSRPLTAP
jgi:hypothetical protein